MSARLVRILIVFALAALGGATSVRASAWAQSAASAAPVLNVYLAPPSQGGSDMHTGLSPSSPIDTLARAEQVLEQRRPDVDVDVRIAQGTYVTGQTSWTYYIPGHTIDFMPANYTLGEGRPKNGDPVFRDTHSITGNTPGWWFQAQLPPAQSDPLHDGGSTGLQFHYLRIEDYTNGISFDGQTGHGSHDSHKPPMYVKPSLGLNGNSVSGMTFQGIGDRFAPGQIGYGAILLTDSSDNVITNNTFASIENGSASWDQIHGVYVTHFSSSNEITANKFTTITGEAVKVRDRSNFNAVERNRFTSTGGVAVYLDQFCDLACVKAHPSIARQCASYGNRFFDNSIGTTFAGTAEQTAWTLIPAGLRYAGGAGCSIPQGQQRLLTGGNT
jgi:hypothetical protein